MPLRFLLLCLAVLAGSALAEPLPAVTALPLAEAGRPRLHDIAASVVPGNDSVLAAELAAVITQVRVDVGMAVRRGDVLLHLDDRDARLQLAQAKAQQQAAAARADLARQRRQRGEELAPQGHLSADELLALRANDAAAEADLAVAEAAHALSRRQLEKTVLRAPFDGEVVARQAQVGASASPGQPLLRVVDSVQREVEAALPVALATALEHGSDAVFHSQGREYPLQLLRVGKVVDPAGRTRLARLGFVAEAAASGSSGQLRWRAAGFTLPADLLVERGNALGVFVLDAGVARFQPLPGALPGRDAATTLPPQTAIVTSGQQALQDGMAVRLGGAP